MKGVKKHSKGDHFNFRDYRENYLSKIYSIIQSGGEI